MTTTSTFQGVDVDSKPSSRVLNPPGGGSSNIFGGYDNQPNARTPVRNNPDNVNRGNNDIFNRDSHAAASTPSLQNPSNVNRGSNDIFNQGSHAAAPQPRSRAPRSEYNPITGELYEKPRAKQEPSAPVLSENDSSSSDVVTANADGGPAETQASAPQASGPQASAPQPEKRQQGGSGIFGGNTQDEPRGHPSTRVIQPPGGRSTKLW